MCDGGLERGSPSRAFRRARKENEERRLQEVVEGLLTEDAPLALPGIVLQEVLSGIRSEKQFADLERRLLASFTIVNPNTGNHVEAARLRNTSLALGLNASGTDCLIAVQAIAGNHELFTMDHDCRALVRHAPLKLYKWSK